MILFITLYLQQVSSFQIFCEQVLNISSESNKKYEISLENPPDSPFFIIGRKSSDPILSISDFGDWKSILDIYSLSSFNTQSRLLSFHSPENLNRLFFSVCSFESFEEFPVLTYSEKTETCEPSCVKKQGKCEKGRCFCEKRFTGDICEIKNIRVTEGYSKRFKIPEFSFIFFECSEDLKLEFKDKSGNIHFFTDKKAFPSFFGFKKYANEFKSFSGIETCPYITAFCAGKECEFKVVEEIEDGFKSQEAIIITSTVLGIFVCLAAFCNLIRYFRSKEPKKIDISETEIDSLAPMRNFEEIGESGACSICLSDFQINDDIRSILKCMHYFHASCISEWFQRKIVCPNCNLSIMDENKI